MSESVSIKVNALVVGQPLAADLIDPQGVLLLRAGVEITQGFIDRLKRRGITQVDQRGAAPAEAAAEAATDVSPRPTKTQRPASRLTPSMVGRLTPADLTAMAAEAEGVFDSAIDRFLGLAPALLDGQLTDLGLAGELITGFGRYLDADPSVVLLLLQIKGDAVGGEGQLYRHGMKSALLTMTLAKQMGLPDAQVVDGGIASLVHDLGMLRVPAGVRETAGPLSAAQRRLIQEHPVHTLNMLDRLVGVSDSIKTAAYQVHERCDASGYPKRRPKQFIHPLAKIAAIADCYNALTADRPYRPALTGHEAMKTILREVQAQKLDRSVARALLDTMSMFPVGTDVGLSDGREARVVRGVPGESVRPIVAVYEDGQLADWELNLAEVTDLQVQKVLDAQVAAA